MNKLSVLKKYLGTPNAREGDHVLLPCGCTTVWGLYLLDELDLVYDSDDDMKMIHNCGKYWKIPLEKVKNDRK